MTKNKVFPYIWKKFSITAISYIVLFILTVIVLMLDSDDKHNPLNLLFFTDRILFMPMVWMYYLCVAFIADWLCRNWLASLFVYVLGGIVFLGTLPLTHKMFVIYTALNKNYHYDNETPHSLANNPGLSSIPVENIILLMVYSILISLVFWVVHLILSGKWKKIMFIDGTEKRSPL